MSLDLILRQGRLTGSDPALVDIGVSAGRIVDIAARIDADAAEEQLDGRLVIAGFVETHIHLDKSCILERCNCERGTLEEVIETVAAAKRAFTEADIHARAQRTLEKAITQGTTRMRTHVEADPRVGLNGFHAVRALKRDYAWALDLEICVFPQEGLTNDPGTEELLVEACEQGADVIGGCPYTDTDPAAQTERIFAIARRFDLDIDFHLDFDLDPSWMHLDEVCSQTDVHRWGGRVATDLFLMGREHQHHVPRGVAPAHRLLTHGVTCSLATNNVLNPFTPFGDCSLIRMANLYANIAQLGRGDDMRACFDMVTTLPARLMNAADYGIAVGHPADLVVIDSRDPAMAVAELARPLFGYKRGRRSFTHAAATIHHPAV